MNQERIQRLLEFLRQDPNDPFSLYALALEYTKGDTTLAAQYFDQLLLQHPKYVPTYYHAAQLFAELGETEKASKIYEDGIIQATIQKDTHALSELQNAYTNFKFELE